MQVRRRDVYSGVVETFFFEGVRGHVISFVLLYYLAGMCMLIPLSSKRKRQVQKERMTQEGKLDAGTDARAGDEKEV